MKNCLLFILLFGFMAMGSIRGCGGSGNNGGGLGGAQALTENDFAEDPLLSAPADEGVVVDFLEPPDSEKPERDTGEVGIDIIPYEYTRAVNNTFCWEDDDQGADDFMILVDSDGVEVLRIEANGDCVTEVIEEGEYKMQIHHDGLSNNTLPVFIEATDQTNGQGAGNTDTAQRVLKTAKRIFSEALRNIGITQESRAQGDVPPAANANVITLVTTRKCIGCKLVRAGLNGAPLELVNLNGADLTGAD